MNPDPAVPSLAEPASLVVVDPNGHRNRVPLKPLPFSIGRQPDNHLVIRDSRASRSHARIVVEAGEYVVQDAGSRHGIFVNGERKQRHVLHDSDRIEFGVPDSYQLVFSLDGTELKGLIEHVGTMEKAAPIPRVGGNLAKLRAILDLARTLQGAFSIEEVLASLVDTALAITGAERGFLLLRAGDKLETHVARERSGRRLEEGDLRVPRDVIRRALEHRRELLSMNFEPVVSGAAAPLNTVADLELRSVICVPLVRMHAGQGNATSILSTGAETLGVLYMDSRLGAADLAGGNRELLQALAIEGSTILENARLLEEAQVKRQIEEELHLAHTIQQSLLPKALPSSGWLRASGSSLASREVGGDYFDVMEVHRHCWSAVVADVSGKGVSSALLASLLQGALITATDQPRALQHRMERINRFIIDRTGGEKYATIFYCLLAKDGTFHYINAAHCPALVVRADAVDTTLEATGMPVGLLETAEFQVAEEHLKAGDKVVIYSDGVTEAQNPGGEFFGRTRLHDVVAAHRTESCSAIHDAIQEAVTTFTAAAAQADDITVLVLEFASTTNGHPL
ncbi:MAG: SpoIIE family protein phosphatase [Acidobacteriia bacterium]|nr:SpoIIE family protein phosphatase [Terriglobia bacterium]